MVPVQTIQLKHVSGVECSESMQPPLNGEQHSVGDAVLF
jgi:hypothetical protein